MNVGYAQITSRPPLFTQILRLQGKLTQELLDEALRLQMSEWRYLGEILCRIAPVTPADIEVALVIQQRYGLQ